MGFVGSNLLPHLLNDFEYSKITVLDNLGRTANPELVPDFTKNYKFKFIEGDIQDKNLVQRLVKENDIIINLAAETFVDSSIADSRIFFETNVMGIHNLLEAARSFGVRKFLQTSTDEVWGQAKNGEFFTESTPYAPRNPYAASKASADHMVRAFGETYGIPFNIVHFTNLYGPWQYPEKLIPISIVRLLEGKKLQIYGEGNNIRTYLHIEDSIKGFLKVLKEGKVGESYALGTQDEKTNIEVARTLISIFGKPESEIEHIKDRPGNDLRYAVDYSKIKQELGWEPQIYFNDGVKDKVDWFREHSDWWGRRR
jgi:dTDP-glucose 4,6-dehydratase